MTHQSTSIFLLALLVALGPLSSQRSVSDNHEMGSKIQMLLLLWLLPLISHMPHIKINEGRLGGRGVEHLPSAQGVILGSWIESCIRLLAESLLLPLPMSLPEPGISLFGAHPTGVSVCEAQAV